MKLWICPRQRHSSISPWNQYHLEISIELVVSGTYILWSDSTMPPFDAVVFWWLVLVWPVTWWWMGWGIPYTLVGMLMINSSEGTICHMYKFWYILTAIVLVGNFPHIWYAGWNRLVPGTVQNKVVPSILLFDNKSCCPFVLSNSNSVSQNTVLPLTVLTILL